MIEKGRLSIAIERSNNQSLSPTERNAEGERINAAHGAAQLIHILPETAMVDVRVTGSPKDYQNQKYAQITILDPAASPKSTKVDLKPYDLHRFNAGVASYLALYKLQRIPLAVEAVKELGGFQEELRTALGAIGEKDLSEFEDRLHPDF